MKQPPPPDPIQTLIETADAIPGAVFRYVEGSPGGNDGSFEYASGGFRELFDLPPDVPLSANKVWSRLHPDDRITSLQLLVGSRTNLTPYEFEFRILSAEGQTARWIWARSNPIRLPDNRVAWCGTLTDITKTKQLESQLRQSQELFFALFHQSPMPAIVTRSMDGLILLVNQVGLDQLGYTREEVIGHNTLELGLISPRERGDRLALLHQGANAPGGYVQLRTRSGVFRDFYGALSLVTYENEECVLGVFFDVTEKLMLEDELKRKNSELAAANAKLEEMDAMKQKFTAMIVHDLKSPLSSVAVALNLLEPRQGDESEFIDLSKRNVEKVVKMVDEMLEVMRAETHEVELVKMTFSPNAFLQGCVNSAQAQAKEKGIELKSLLEEDLPLLEADPAKLDRVFSNLISNAIKFTPCGGTISIGARTIQGVGVEEGLDFLLVNVTDSGCGIPAEDLPFIFDLYRQSKFNQGQIGVGLGLAIVKSIIAAHGGNVSVRSQVGVGSQFSVVLPTKI